MRAEFERRESLQRKQITDALEGIREKSTRTPEEVAVLRAAGSTRTCLAGVCSSGKANIRTHALTAFTGRFGCTRWGILPRPIGYGSLRLNGLGALSQMPGEIMTGPERSLLPHGRHVD